MCLGSMQTLILPGVKVYIDDIIIWETTEAEHEARLRTALRAASRAGLTLNTDKCRFGVKEVVFLGDRISALGIQPD